MVSLGCEEACEVLMVSDGGVCRRAGMSILTLGNEFGKTRRCGFWPGTAGMSICAAWHQGGLLTQSMSTLGGTQRRDKRHGDLKLGVGGLLERGSAGLRVGKECV